MHAEFGAVTTKLDGMGISWRGEEIAACSLGCKIVVLICIASPPCVLMSDLGLTSKMNTVLPRKPSKNPDLPNQRS